jgi:hypothetical protein
MSAWTYGPCVLLPTSHWIPMEICQKNHQRFPGTIQRLEFHQGSSSLGGGPGWWLGGCPGYDPTLTLSAWWSRGEYMWLIMIVNNHLVVIIWLLYGDYMVIICLMMVHNHLVGGIATYPSEKSRSEDCQLGWWKFPTFYGKSFYSHGPNQQPVVKMIQFSRWSWSTSHELDGYF